MILSSVRYCIALYTIPATIGLENLLELTSYHTQSSKIWPKFCLFKNCLLTISHVWDFCRIECVMMNLTNVVPMLMKLTIRWEKQACGNIQTDTVIIMSSLCLLSSHKDSCWWYLGVGKTPFWTANRFFSSMYWLYLFPWTYSFDPLKISFYSNQLLILANVCFSKKKKKEFNNITI